MNALSLVVDGGMSRRRACQSYSTFVQSIRWRMGSNADPFMSALSMQIREKDKLDVTHFIEPTILL